jgi:hypothetical protein
VSRRPVTHHGIADWLRLQSGVGQDRGGQSSLFQRVEHGGVNSIFFFSY